MMAIETAGLAEVLSLLWTDLLAGAANLEDPFHTPAFGSLTEDGPGLRIVVLRQVDPARRLLACHSDIRSIKIGQLERNPASSWLFYAAERKIQIRAEGTATVHHGDEIARAAWQETSLSSRRSYLALLPPGSPVAQADSGLPSGLNDRSPTLEESEPGQANFCVIATSVTRLEWLHLDAKGHRRAAFSWQEGAFQGSWLIP